MKLVPIEDRVVLKMDKAEATTKSGIILTSGNQEEPAIGTIMAVGAGTADVTMLVKEGQRVVIGKFAGSVVKVDGEAFTVVRQSEIIGILED